MINHERVAYLIKGAIERSASGAELLELTNLLKQDTGEITTRVEVLLKEYETIGRPDLTTSEIDEMANNVLQADRIGKQAPGKIKVMTVWKRIAVAASVILVLAAGTYFLLVNKTRKQIAKMDVQQQRFKNDIAPGGNKAILTLSNGSQIILDSAANGTLTQQGNTKIIKLDSGQLAYQESGPSPLGAAGSRFNTITTPKGGQYQIVLADGSKVWLNAASSLKFPTAFSGKERNVELTGEGYFEVAHNATMPFHVTVNGMQVEVLGTHFNINAYDDESAIKTTLLEGSVKVSKGLASKMINPGEQAILQRAPGDEADIKVVTADLDEAVAWKNGLFKYNNTDITTVMRQISRWYDVTVSYPKGLPKDRYWGGIPRNLNLANVFKVLDESGAHFTIEGKKVTVLP